MPNVELGGSPKDGFNEAETSTDLSSADITRTTGSFNTAGGQGLYGESAEGDGTWGYAHASGFSGVVGIHSTDGNGVFGRSSVGDGVCGVADGEGRSGVVGIHHGKGNAVFGRAASPGYAGWFDGNVMVSGDIILENADCAEDFDVLAETVVAPGTVMVLDEDGALQESDGPYDRRVAGVVSGAGDLKPGVILDRHRDRPNRLPIALLGKTYCRVDATTVPIAVGDLLTTGTERGHAMKADDPARAFGAVIGKALRALPSGQGLIPILVCLQ